jgi:hypothetical protein
MAQIEVGAQGGRIVLKVPVADPGGETASVVTMPLTADEARDMVNGLGEAIKFLSG